MKKVLFLMILLFLIVSGTATMDAQVKIGENAIPRKGAVLDLNGSYKGGLLLPHVEISDMGKIPEDFHDTSVRGKDEVLELAGLMVWNTGTGSEGVYVWDGKDWQVVTGGSTTPPLNCTAPPAAPASIDLTPASIKVGETITATCDVVTGATSYVWTLPPGLTADPLETENNQLVIKGTTVTLYPAGSVTVQARNTCGLSSGYGSSANPVDVQNSPSGNTVLGITGTCNYMSKSACTCDSGTPLSYSEANATQRIAAGAAYMNKNWYYTRTDSDNMIVSNEIYSWSVPFESTIGSFFCF